MDLSCGWIKLKKLKIAYFSPRYYPYIGGVEYAVRNLAEHFTLNGHDVTVIAGDPQIKKTIDEKVNGVNVKRIPTYTLRESYHIPRDRTAVSNILSESFDIVHVNSIHAVFSLLPLHFKKNNNPDWNLVLSPHHSIEGYGFLRQTIWKLFWKRNILRYLKYVDLVHVTSPVEADIVSDHFPCVKNKLVCVGLGIEDDVMTHNWTGQNSDYILYCGRIEKYKRVDLVIKAISCLANRGQNIRLVLVGSGSFSKNIQNSCDTLGDFVEYSPPVSREEYLALISNARAVISLSSAENFNLFLAEAHSMGVPIIATREAVAFRPELSNVADLSVNQVANTISKKISSIDKDTSNFRTLKPWNEVVQDLEVVYNSMF